MKEWQLDILFFVAVGGAIYMLIGPEFGLESTSNPTAVTGIGTILAYVLTQKKSWSHKDSPPELEDRDRYKREEDEVDE